MCRLLNVHRSGFYAWSKNPKSNREIEDERLYRKIEGYWSDSDQTYGSPRIYKDLRESGETCGLNRVAKIMRQRKLKAIRGYKKRKYKYSKPSDIAENLLNQKFDVDGLNKVWVSDITQITTLEGLLYLAVVIDLHSRRVVGWSMSSSMHRDIVYNEPKNQDNFQRGFKVIS
jgi:putative transposase